MKKKHNGTDNREKTIKQISKIKRDRNSERKKVMEEKQEKEYRLTERWSCRRKWVWKRMKTKEKNTDTGNITKFKSQIKIEKSSLHIS